MKKIIIILLVFQFNDLGAQIFCSEAKFNGGEYDLKVYLRENKIYPEKAKKDSIEGIVDVLMVIDTIGKPKIIKTTGSEIFKMEAIRLVENMPNWTPAKYYGKLFEEKVGISINFELTEGNLKNEKIIIRQIPEENSAIYIAQQNCPLRKADQMPDFPGGYKEMYKYIQKNLVYPKEVSDKGKYWNSMLIFIVNIDGSIENITILGGKDEGKLYDEEAVRVVKSMPKWIPGKQNGKEVRVEYSLIVTFEPSDDAIQEAPLAMVEQMPAFPGGEKEMMKYVKKSIVYPKEEQEKGISGVCYVTFVVEKDGTLTDVKVIKGLAGAPGCDKEAVRVVKSMPNWIPGKQNGREVRVQFNLPVKFELNK